MRASWIGAAEEWGWRALMPALIFGGNAAGMLLFVIFVLRLMGWWGNHRSQSWNWPQGAAWWMGYFGLQLLGGLWSEDLAAWGLSLEVKSALWFLPLLAAMPGKSVGRAFWWSVGWAVSVYIACRMLRAGWFQWCCDDASGWRYARFAGDVHPTYLGLHAALALLGLGVKWGRSMGPMALWTLTALLAAGLGMTGSKAGILAGAVVVVLRLVMWFLGRKNEGWNRRSAQLEGQPMRWLAFLLILAAVSFGMSRARFAEMGTATIPMTGAASDIRSSSAGRVFVWQSSVSILGEHPFGVGTGDVIPALMEVYADEGVDYALDRALNPHNQWLQAGVAFGWPGILVLTLAFFSMLRWAWRRQDGLLLLCTLLVMMHAAVESVLEVQRGVVFILWLYATQWRVESEPPSASGDRLH